MVCLQCRRPRFDPWVGKIPWRRKWQLTPVFLPGEPHRQGSLLGCSLWGHHSLCSCKKSDMTERLTLSVLYRGSVSQSSQLFATPVKMRPFELVLIQSTWHPFKRTFLVRWMQRKKSYEVSWKKFPSTS